MIIQSMLKMILGLTAVDYDLQIVNFTDFDLLPQTEVEKFADTMQGFMFDEEGFDSSSEQGLFLIGLIKCQEYVSRNNKKVHWINKLPSSKLIKLFNDIGENESLNPCRKVSEKEYFEALDPTFFIRATIEGDFIIMDLKKLFAIKE